MKLKQIGTLAHGGQDGAFWGRYAFRFDADGTCRVYDVRALDKLDRWDGVTPMEFPLVNTFSIDPDDPLIPHCNAVVFGKDYYAPEDEFPLLYANVYNNYAGEEDRLEGTLCVYRLTKHLEDGKPVFQTHLQQIIRLGFVENPLWCSGGETKDVRPYGNFVVDRQQGLLHAFTMRDADHKTRYFTFALPSPVAGEMSPKWGVPVVTLGKEDVKHWFDVDYHNFIQGACCHHGLIYSSEGFNKDIHPALRVIDPEAGVQLQMCDLTELGYDTEAEWIDFRRGVCYYSDAAGKLYMVEFAEE